MKVQKSQSLQQLRERIFEMRHELAVIFEGLDKDSNGEITKNQWVEGTYYQYYADIYFHSNFVAGYGIFRIELLFYLFKPLLIK